jgi:zinc transport system ATP-binding protein
MIIECKNAEFAYDGNTAVTGLDFEVENGDYLCIVGENGSGKSTLIKGLLKLKKPIKGEVLFGDGLTSGEVGYLPQQTQIQRNFPAGVYEVVLSGCLSKRGKRPFYSRAEKALAQENMKKLAIEPLRNKCYRELSGGQQQRVLLARALCATGRLLLLDEPVTGLDPVAAQEMYNLIDGLNKNEKITVIMVSHDINSVIGYATKVLHLDNCQSFYGDPKTYAKTEYGMKFLSCGCDHTGGDCSLER